MQNAAAFYWVPVTHRFRWKLRTIKHTQLGAEFCGSNVDIRCILKNVGRYPRRALHAEIHKHLRWISADICAEFCMQKFGCNLTGILCADFLRISACISTQLCHNSAIQRFNRNVCRIRNANFPRNCRQTFDRADKDKSKVCEQKKWDVEM